MITLVILLLLVLVFPAGLWVQSDLELDSTIVPISMLAKIDTLIEHTTLYGFGTHHVTLSSTFNNRGQRLHTIQEGWMEPFENIYSYTDFGRLEYIRRYSQGKLRYFTQNTYDSKERLIKE